MSLLNPTFDSPFIDAEYPTRSAEGPSYSQVLDHALAPLESAFGESFTVIDPGNGAILRPVANSLLGDLPLTRMPLLEEIARRGQPEVVEEVDPLLLLAVPIALAGGALPVVALGTFVTDQPNDISDVTAAAEVFGVNPNRALRWIESRSTWPPHAPLALARAFNQQASSQQVINDLQTQVAETSRQLLHTFEEITLLHRLTQHLSLSGGVAELCRLAAGWLSDVVPAQCIAIKMAVNSEEASNDDAEERESVLIIDGECPLPQTELDQFIRRLSPDVQTKPVVLNGPVTSLPTWFYPQVREVICVPIREGERIFGWLAALNHTSSFGSETSEGEFGTVEASLMSSVAVILGIHGGNIDLYREKSDFFASVVLALTSAIDAKDPYTCGHSERVARLSVCLARELGCSTEELNTLYLSGLLHDIGKIGIDTNVLRKPGKLTAEEYEHIKQHPRLGYEILHGVKQLDKVLPVVLHHHEAWDGSGYPDGLQGEACPKLARIAAVADSIDAMSSDRPYRKGMPDEKLNEILRTGAGKQWDAEVIDAVFRVRDKIREIRTVDREHLSLDVSSWR